MKLYLKPSQHAKQAQFMALTSETWPGMLVQARANYHKQKTLDGPFVVHMFMYAAKEVRQGIRRATSTRIAEAAEAINSYLAERQDVRVGNIARTHWGISHAHQPDDASVTLPETAKIKLEVRQVDFNSLSAADIKPSDKVDAAFWCMGTTRKDAGSADTFRKDLEYVIKSAEVSKAADVPYMDLLTSQVEDKVQHMKFQRTSIFRHGMLQRGDMLQGTEKMFGWMIPGAVAKGMISVYESDAEGLEEWSHADLKRIE
ncbi:NAD(P)-binding domain [Phytophthora cactorum]|nr:NAD(P)-binding domain [Phytophthora cactorum]